MKLIKYVFEILLDPSVGGFPHEEDPMIQCHTLLGNTEGYCEGKWCAKIRTCKFSETNGISGELEFVRVHIYSKLEFFRIEIFQNWNLSELAIISFGAKKAMKSLLDASVYARCEVSSEVLKKKLCSALYLARFKILTNSNSDKFQF